MQYAGLLASVLAAHVADSCVKWLGVDEARKPEALSGLNSEHELHQSKRRPAL